MIKIMMKKMLPVFAIASMMLATSCSNDELSNLNEGTNSTVTFTTQLANPLQTRAFADGTTATTLDYAVYEVKDGAWTLLPDLGKTDQTINMSTTVSLNLVNGKTYAVVFWADAPSSIYTFDATNVNVKADYTSATSSNENYDAFYAVEQFTVDGATLDRTVNLKRPFAQLNIGTSDLAAAKSAGIDVTKAGVTVKTYNTLNFKDGSVDGEAEIEFAAAELPEEAFPVTTSGCKYLAMNYLLMPTDKKADNTVTISYDGAADARAFQNIPLQRNFRTNIFGSLLTSANNFNVSIAPEFDNPDYGFNVWDGSVKEITPNAEGVYEVTTGAELAWIAQQTRNKETFAGKTIKLMNDIDLNYRAWKGIGNDDRNADFTKYAFAGTFDGNGKTIYNLNVKSYCENADNATAGLFNTIQSGAVIKNLTVKNATVKSTHYAGVIAGYNWVSGSNAEVTIEGCTIENATVTSTAALMSTGKYDNGDKVGGIVGYLCHGTVTGCKVKNSTITAYRDLGGIVGCVGVAVYNEPSTISNNTIEGVALAIDKTQNYKNITTQEGHNAGSYLGRNETWASGTAAATVTDNTGEATIVY